MARANAAEVSRDLDGVALARVAAEPVERFLRADRPERYGLVFLDPPYDLGEDALGAVLAALGAHLEPEALVVVERSSRSPEPPWRSGMALADTRAYGETRLWFARAPRAVHGVNTCVTS